MSWSDKITNIKFSIVTGDGKAFYPLWKDSEKSKDFNATAFDFINVAGSLVERRKPKANKIPLTFFFDGDDCIEQSEDFWKSSDDNRFWTVTHPYYGTIKGQPLSISKKDTNLNISEITVDFWESISVDYPNFNFSVKDNSLDKTEKTLSSLVNSAVKPVYETSDIQKVKDMNVNNSSSFTAVTSDPASLADDFYAQYQNKISKAMTNADGLLNETYDAIQSAQELTRLPARVETSISVRLGAYQLAFDKAKEVLLSVADKFRFESNAGSILASLANAAVNPSSSDYVVVTEIQNVAQIITDFYAEYLEIMDNASVSIYDIDNSWQPNAEAQNNLYDLITFTVSNLFNLGFESQQERIVYLEKDTNFILLTHKYLGMDANDENLETFRRVNDIKFNELLKLKKERKIIYYV